MILRGAMQMARFLSGDRFITIQWLEKKQTEKDLIKPNMFRKIIAPFAVAGVIIWRSFGLSSILNLMEKFSAAGEQISDTIIPFNEGQEAFQESTLWYLMRGFYASLISMLSSLNLLV